MPRPPISVLLPTYNCASIVRNTLESIKWADEILAVDSYSTDATLSICREYGARIIQHEYITSAKQKNWAVPQCQHEWVLQIDTDEVLETGLREEMEGTLATIPPTVHAFRIPRKNYFHGHWLRFGGNYPDYQVRLFRRDEGRWQDREVHAHVLVRGEVRCLQLSLVHDDTPYLSKCLQKLNRYTRYEADELHKQGKRFHWLDLLIRPWLIFLYRYLWLQGFRDGGPGFVDSAYTGIYVFLARAKLWEMKTLDLNASPK